MRGQPHRGKRRTACTGQVEGYTEFRVDAGFQIVQKALQESLQSRSRKLKKKREREMARRTLHQTHRNEGLVVRGDDADARLEVAARVGTVFVRMAVDRIKGCAYGS
jgi:hypothetical protein